MQKKTSDYAKIKMANISTFLDENVDKFNNIDEKLKGINKEVEILKKAFAIFIKEQKKKSRL